MILGSFFAALGQIADPRFRRVLFLGIGLTIALFVAFYIVTMFLLNWLSGSEFMQGIFASVPYLSTAMTAASFIVFVILSIFLMVPVASAITSIFLDQVAQAVEDKHYPHLPPVKPVPFWDGVRDTVGFLGVLIGANLLALILYAFFAPFTLFIFWGLNGFLLGREYIMLVAMRRLGRDKAKELRRRNSGRIWLAGILMAIPLSVPLFNLVIPIMGAATFTHLFHRIQAKEAGGS